MNMIKKMWATAVLFVLGTITAFAQSGVNGLNTATTTLKTYVAPVTNITLVIGGIVGIVGAVFRPLTPLWAKAVIVPRTNSTAVAHIFLIMFICC